MRTLTVILLVTVVTIAWMWNQCHAPRFDTSDTGPGAYSFRQELAGDAPKGICYRVFVPYLCRAAQWIAPEGALSSLAAKPPLREMILEPDLMPAYAMAGAVAFASFLISGLTCGPVTLLLAWACMSPHGHVGDPVTLATFSVGVWALMSKRTPWLWAAFALACFNRETAPLLMVFYYLYQKYDRENILGHDGWMIGLAAWGAVRILLVHVYADNAMTMAWPMLEHNLKAIGRISLTTVLVALPVGALVWADLKRREPWFRHGFVAALFCLVVMTLLWSRIDRVRTYLEIVPMVSVCLTAAVARLAKGER